MYVSTAGGCYTMVRAASPKRDVCKCRLIDPQEALFHSVEHRARLEGICLPDFYVALPDRFPLHAAVLEGDLDQVKALLDSGWNPNAAAPVHFPQTKRRAARMVEATALDLVFQTDFFVAAPDPQMPLLLERYNAHKSLKNPRH